MDFRSFLKQLSFQFKKFPICTRKRGGLGKQIWLISLPLILSFIFNLNYSIQPVEAWVTWIDNVGRYADDVGRYADNLDGVLTKRNLRKKNVHKSANEAFRRLNSHRQAKLAINSSYLSFNSNGGIELISSIGHTKVYSNKDLLVNQLLSDLEAVQTTSLILPDETFFKLQDIFNDTVEKLDIIDNLLVMAPDGKLLHTRLIESANGFERVIELDPKHPNLAIGVKKLSEYDNTLRLRQQSLNKNDIRVISLFDESDPDVINALNRASGEYHITFSSKRNNVDSFFRNQNLNNKIIFVVGHTEGKKFVVRQADNKIAATFDISNLTKTAEEFGNTLILLGCETAKLSGESGYIQYVVAEDVAKRIEKAIKAENYTDMLLSLASNDTFVVRSSVAERASLITEISIRHEKEAVDAMSRSVGILSRTATRRLRLNSVNVIYVNANPNIFKIIFLRYFSIIPFSIFNFRVSWRRFMSAWPLIIPRFNSGERFRSLFLYLLRAVAFAIILPWDTYIFILKNLGRLLLGIFKEFFLWPFLGILYIILLPFIGILKLAKLLYSSFRND